MTDQTIPADRVLPEANDTNLPLPTRTWVLDAESAPVVWTAPGGRVMIQRIEPGDLTPAQARTFALNILAAAAYAAGPTMTDQTVPADVTPEDMAHARAYVQDFLDATHGPDRTLAVARVLQALLPAPQRPTLADMTEEEWDACQWMQADLSDYGSRVVILNPGWDDGSARVMWMHTRIGVVPHRDITPRPDLDRMELPGDQKPEPAPALPDGWRLADHPQYGPVVVTSMEPDDDGYVWFVRPDPYGGSEGYDAGCCKPDALTYLGQEVDQ